MRRLRAATRRRRTAAWCVLGWITLALFTEGFGAWAAFAHVATATQPISTATLQPPTGLSVSTSCSGLLSFSAKGVVTWTATPSTSASGHVIERWRGSTLQATIHVTPRTTTSYTDEPLSTGTTYTWKVRAEVHLWTSSLIQANGTTPGLCL